MPYHRHLHSGMVSGSSLSSKAATKRGKFYHWIPSYAISIYGIPIGCCNWMTKKVVSYVVFDFDQVKANQTSDGKAPKQTIDQAKMINVYQEKIS